MADLVLAKIPEAKEAEFIQAVLAVMPKSDLQLTDREWVKQLFEEYARNVYRQGRAELRRQQGQISDTDPFAT